MHSIRFPEARAAAGDVSALGFVFDSLTRQLAVELHRFSAPKAELSPATPRALALTFKHRIGNDLVTRSVIDDFLPAPLYDLTSRGQVIGLAL